LIRRLCPYPTVGAAGDLADGHLVKQPRICMKCTDRSCARFDGKGVELAEGLVAGKCPRGLALIAAEVGCFVVVVNGVLLKGVEADCPPKLRKQYRDHRISIESLRMWRDFACEMPAFVAAEVDRRAKEVIASLHDVRTAVGLVYRNADALIMSNPGDSDYEKIEGADPALKSLLKSVALLKTRLDMSSLLANPAAAEYGRKRPRAIYKLLDRMCHLFKEIAARRKVALTIRGPSTNRVPVYDSFETIPLVLIDNAVKYSEKGSEAQVIVRDRSVAVDVRVRSYGPPVSDDEHSRIFDRGHRSTAAEAWAASGSGLGLYLARVVAAAHGFSIFYKPSMAGRDGLCWNEFSFTVGEVRSFGAGICS